MKKLYEVFWWNDPDRGYGKGDTVAYVWATSTVCAVDIVGINKREMFPVTDAREIPNPEVILGNLEADVCKYLQWVASIREGLQ